MTKCSRFACLSAVVFVFYVIAAGHSIQGGPTGPVVVDDDELRDIVGGKTGFLQCDAFANDCTHPHPNFGLCSNGTFLCADTPPQELRGLVR